MADLQISADVAAGKKANERMSIYNTSLEEAGIENITDIEFSFHIFLTESWETVTDTDQITIKTSASGNYAQAYDDSGDIIYDNNGSVVYPNA